MSAPLRAAVVIPAYKQPGLLAEAILSALEQSEPCHVVVVVDGCPMAETYETAACFARAHPDRVFAIRRENGGVSAARNTGIDFTLASWRDVEAVMFLDADNRIAPEFMARALRSLRGAPAEVGWVYPDIDMIGLDESSDMGGEFSRLALLDWNYCDAGSVVRRGVLERGLRFDETSRLSFEDWDFWLQAVAAGYVGRHLPNAGFGYRRRSESRFSAACRSREVILETMNAKRRDSLRPRRLLELEAVEAPRFALVFAGEGCAHFTSDPLVLGAKFTLAEAAARLREAEAHASVARFPAYCCFMSQEGFAALVRLRIAASIFWLAQTRLRKAARLRVFLRRSAQPEVRLTEAEAVDLPDDDAAAIFFATMNSAGAKPAVDLFVDLPDDEPPPPGAARAEREFAAALGACPAGPRRTWRRDIRPPRNDLLALYGRVCGVGALLPMLRPKTSRAEIGFVVPVHTFGGVEKVVTSQARVLGKLGFRSHLFVTGGSSFLATPAASDAFASVNLVLDPGFDRAAWGQTYFGAPMSETGGEENRDALGLLSTMDVVLDTHSLGARGLAARLRSWGIVTLTALHIVECDVSGAPIGNPHIALAYEHAYDGVLVISEHLRLWCLAHGVPEAKIMVVPNAPSYPARAPNPRGARREGPLRALFLGRLDVQKGLDRLAAIIAATRGAGVQWRIVGKPVLDEAPAFDFGVAVEAPLHDAQALDDAYDWADVLVLPSRFEGAPLTVLEARRRGVVVVATRVGAVAEIIGAGGYLVEGAQQEAALVSEFVRRLDELARDRALLAARAQAALADPPPEAEATVRALVEFLEGREFKANV